MSFWSRHKKQILFVLILVSLAFFFRFYNLSNLQYWMFDEERDAFVIKRILVDKHPTLIGGAVPGAFYLAPGYFYISAIFYFLSNGNPIGPAIAASALGVLSVFLLLKCVKEFFGKMTAVFASILYTCSFLVILYNRTWWPLVFAPTVSLVTYLSLYKIIKFSDFRWCIPLSLALTVGAHTDPSNFSLIVLTIIVFVVYKLSVRNKYVLYGMVVFLVSHLPLLIFDLRHNFFNTKLLLKMLSFGNANGNFDFLSVLKSMIIFPQTLARVIFISPGPDVALQIIPFKYYLDLKYSQIPQLLLFLAYLVFAWFGFQYFLHRKDKKYLALKIIFIHLVVAFVGIFLYSMFFPNYIYEWFLQVLFPAFAIIVGLFLASLFRIASKLRFSFIIWAILAFFIFLSINSLLRSSNSFSFGQKSQATKWAISQVGSSDFSLDSPSSYFSYGGYRYLFYLYGHEPVKSYMDPVFRDWMYPSSAISVSHPDLVVAIMNPDYFYDEAYQGKYFSYLKRTISRQKFGRIEVLVVDNRDKWVSW